LRADSSSETRDTYRRDELWRMFNVQLITSIRANMKNTLLPLLDKLLLRRRVIVETIVDQFLAD
jgi:hypothetical protein